MAALPGAGAVWLLQSQVLARSQAKNTLEKEYFTSQRMARCRSRAAFPLRAIEGADLPWVGAVSRGISAGQCPVSRGLEFVLKSKLGWDRVSWCPV